MTPKDLHQLEINALALRNMADTVLDQVARLKKSATTAITKTRQKAVVAKTTEANVVARVLTNKRKPL